MKKIFLLSLFSILCVSENALAQGEGPVSPDGKYRVRIDDFRVQLVTTQVPTGLSFFPYYTIQYQHVTAKGEASWTTNIGSGWSDLLGLDCSVTPKKFDLLNLPNHSEISPYISNLSSSYGTNKYMRFIYRITAWNDNTADLQAIVADPYESPVPHGSITDPPGLPPPPGYGNLYHGLGRGY
jgi:hypothetical protein